MTAVVEPVGDVGPRASSPAYPVTPYQAGGVGPSTAGWAPSGALPDELIVPLLTGAHTPARRLRFVLVNACTVSSLLLGVTAIFLVLGDYARLGAVAVLGCVVFDGLDGMLARRLGVSTPFGAQMDSLADMCSFGLATPVVSYAWLTNGWCARRPGRSGVCVGDRLRRDPVGPIQRLPEERLLLLRGADHHCRRDPRAVCAPHPPSGTGLAGAAVGALALLTGVSTFPYVKLGRALQLPPWLWAVPIAGALIDVPTTFTLLVAVYLASGPLLWMRQRSTAPAV